MASLSPIEFIVPNFETEITLDVCGTLSAAFYTMDVSAVADLNVDASLVRLAFQIQTDASDVVDASFSDIKYFVDREAFWASDSDHSFSINAADAVLNTAATAPLVPILDSSAQPSKYMVCHDFIRYIASKLFNTPYGVDLFKNEIDLLNDVRLKSQKVWAVIDNQLIKYDITSRPGSNTTIMHGVTYDAQASPLGTLGSDNYYSNDDVDNVCKKLLEQMAYYNPARLSTIRNSTDKQPIPFIGGDSISLKLTINPEPNQHNLTNVSAFGARTFRIRFNLIEGYLDTFDHSQEVLRDLTDLTSSGEPENNNYRTFVPPVVV